MFGQLLADRANMEQKWWTAQEVGSTQDDDRFLFLLSLAVAVLGVLGLMLYLAL